MSCRKNSPGNPCCANPDCETACTGEDTPLSVTLTLPWSLDGTTPTEQTFTLVNRGLIDGPCSKYQAGIDCGAEVNWSILEDRSCVSDWPASNINDTAWAVGVTTGCTTCSGYTPSSYKRWYEETQQSGRVTVWVKKSYSGTISLEPYGTDGLIRVRFGVTYGEAGAISQVQGARNRVKIVTITCVGNTGTVSSVSDWIEADEPVLPDPIKCVTTSAAKGACSTTQETVTPYDQGSCTETSLEIDTATIVCTSVPIVLRNAIGVQWCNASPTAFDMNGCDFPSASGTLISINGPASSSGGVLFVQEWTAIVDCHELYGGAIVLSGGPVSGTVTYPFVGSPAIDSGLGVCTYTGAYGSRTWSVPTTISVVINH